MWNGAFSPQLEKASSQAKWEPLADDDDPFNTYIEDEIEFDDPAFAEDIFDVVEELEIVNRSPSSKAKKSWDEDAHPKDKRGILWIKMRVATTSQDYGFPATFGQYLEFQGARFSLSWIRSNYNINYVGDWGWPWGRTRQTGWAG